MALLLEVELLTRTYEAGIGGERAEWPPHPARVFCALVAHAESEEERAALRWLENQDPPELEIPEASSSVLWGYVPTNAVTQKPGSAVYPARTNGSRVWARTLPAEPSFRVVWPSANPSPEAFQHLARLAGRVSYVGRPAGMVLMRVHKDVAPREALPLRLVPKGVGPYLLRVPYPGYLDALIAKYQTGGLADEASRTHPYADTTDASATQTAVSTETTVVSGPYARLCTLGFPSGSGIDGWHTARVAAALRAAVLSRLGKPRQDDPWQSFTPEELVPMHGHREKLPPDQRCAFLALPFVGYPHATGELIGVGIAIGSAVDVRLRRAVLQLFGLDRDEGPRLADLRIAGLGVTLPLSAPDGRWSVESNRWCRPARRWATALPVVLDRWPKRWVDVAEVIAEGVRMAGYPEPAEIEVRRGAAVAGAPFLRAEDRKRRPEDSDRPWTHVVVSFIEPVRGPVLLGHLRFSGLGLCVPLDDERGVDE
ncbi:MAG: type I-U CRISPR-associated protein Cas5/Cas6 [Acidothermus sp.]|nr:type I-U CRISPR-associated protein Cas5/Cas6 [Acidothermus sp.]